MDNTYYVIDKVYEGLFFKKHKSNRHMIVTTDKRSNDGIIFHLISKVKIHDKTGKFIKEMTGFITNGYYSYNSDEIIEDMKKDEGFVILEKIPSEMRETVDKNIDECDPIKMKSSVILKLKLQNTGKYFKSKEATFLYFAPSKNDYHIFISDLKLDIETELIPSSALKMAAYKTQSMINSVENNTGNILKNTGAKLRTF